MRDSASGLMTGHTIDRAFAPILRLLPQREARGFMIPKGCDCVEPPG